RPRGVPGPSHGAFLARHAPARRPEPGAPSRAARAHPGRALRRPGRAGFRDPERAPPRSPWAGCHGAPRVARSRAHGLGPHANLDPPGRRGGALDVTALRVLAKDLKL